MEVRPATLEEVQAAQARGNVLKPVRLALCMESCITETEMHENFYATIERGFEPINEYLGAYAGSCSIVGSAPLLPSESVSRLVRPADPAGRFYICDMSDFCFLHPETLRLMCASAAATLAGSSNGRTPPFEGGYWGSNPWPAAMLKSEHPQRRQSRDRGERYRKEIGK